MFELDQDLCEVFPKTFDLFSDDNKDDHEEINIGRLNARNLASHRWKDDEIKVILAAFTRHKHLNQDELARIAIQMRQGNTPSAINQWFKSCRANQGKVVRQERARRRDARYTKAK